jgi:hypothetical protein
MIIPGLSLRFNPWAEIANAFGVFSNCTTTCLRISIDFIRNLDILPLPEEE